MTKKEESLTDRVAFITGATRGIGRAVALELARRGAHIIASGRSVSKLEELDDEVRKLSGSATLLQLDLCDASLIDSLGPTLSHRWSRIDILIGNAGQLGPLAPLVHVSQRDWSRIIDINLTANWHLIRTLDPLLQRSKAGRAVFVTSRVSKTNRAYWGIYSTSKAGLEALVKTYAHENLKTCVNVNLVDPGATRTQLRAQAFPGEDPLRRPPPARVASLIAKLSLPSCVSNGKIYRMQTKPLQKS